MNDKRMYIEVDEKLRQALKIKAATEGKTMRELVTKALLVVYPELEK